MTTKLAKLERLQNTHKVASELMSIASTLFFKIAGWVTITPQFLEDFHRLHYLFACADVNFVKWKGEKRRGTPDDFAMPSGLVRELLDMVRIQIDMCGQQNIDKDILVKYQSFGGVIPKAPISPTTTSVEGHGNKSTKRRPQRFKCAKCKMNFRLRIALNKHNENFHKR